MLLSALKSSPTKISILVRARSHLEGTLPPPLVGTQLTLPPPDFVIDSSGIVATPDNRWLLLVNTMRGTLYQVDPQTGDATSATRFTTQRKPSPLGLQ
jgi:hypothetical protein